MKYYLFVIALMLALVALVMGETCSPFCTLEYSPICAGNDQTKPMTFANKCLFNHYNCEHPNSPLKMLKSESCGDHP
ncbi:hypothetical protein C0J52_24698 [Blattella germanica]|nr:hypothetical protein C0J52_24698 [Blattella germanica]